MYLYLCTYCHSWIGYVWGKGTTVTECYHLMLSSTQDCKIKKDRYYKINF